MASQGSGRIAERMQTRTVSKQGFPQNLKFAASHLGLHDVRRGTAIGKGSMQSRKVNTRPTRVPVDHAGFPGELLGAAREKPEQGVREPKVAHRTRVRMSISETKVR